MPLKVTAEKQKEKSIEVTKLKQTQVYGTNALSTPPDAAMPTPDGLMSPVPKAAKEKALTRTVKSVFGFGKQSVPQADTGDLSPSEFITTKRMTLDDPDDEALVMQKKAQASKETEVSMPKLHTFGEDLTEEERSSESEKFSQSNTQIIREMIDKDIEAGLNEKGESKYSAKMQEILADLKLVYAKKQTKACVPARKRVRTFLHELKQEIDKVQAETEVEKKTAAAEAMAAKYKDILDEEKMGELTILAGYAAMFDREQEGRLEYDGAKVINQPKDSLFMGGSKNMKFPIDMDDGTKLISNKLVNNTKECDRRGFPLFNAEPNVGDLIQGDIGDCYMIAGLRSIVQSNPDHIKDSMKDEGDTVVVRFYKQDGSPIYVRVQKTIPQYEFKKVDKDGNPVNSLFYPHGSLGPLWVKMLEKAYAVARPLIVTGRDKYNIDKQLYEGDTQYAAIKSGLPSDFIQQFTGKEAETYNLDGSIENFDQKFHHSSELFKIAHYGSKKEFFKQNKGAKARDWNLHKAKTIFGVDTENLSEKAYDVFRNNTLFAKYEFYLWQFLHENFESKIHKDGKKGLVTAAQFSTVADLDYFISRVDISKMPDLKIPGLDDTAMKKSYLKHFRESVVASGILKQNVNTTGDYSDRELEVYKNIEAALHKGPEGKEKAMVTASYSSPSLVWKDEESEDGSGGEKIILGAVSQHAYSVVDVKTEENLVNGKIVKNRFVILANPWANKKIRRYDDKGNSYTNTKTKNAKGIFKMELSDFVSTYGRYTIT